MKRIFILFLSGLLVYLLAVLWLLPAERWLAIVQTQLPQLRVAQISGNIFAGRSAGVRFNQLFIPEFNWHWQSAALPKWHWQIAAGLDRLNGGAKISLGTKVKLENIQGQLALNTVSRWLNLPFSSGQGQLHIKELELILNPAQSRLHSAEGLLIIEQLQLSGKTPLTGSFELRLSTDNNQIQGIITSLDSPLVVQARLLLTDNQYQINGQISAHSNADAELRAMLQQFGNAGTDGKHQFQYSGQL